MNFLPLLGFFFLSASFLSLWFRKNPKLWGSLLILSLASGLCADNIFWMGLVWIGIFAQLWNNYSHKPSVLLLAVLTAFAVGFKLHLFPGYNPIAITSKFKMGFESPLIGLFPLALLIPLAKTSKDWKKVFQGTLLGCAGIFILAVVAIFSGAVSWSWTLPSLLATRLFSNLVLTCIPEEGFFRGFLQKEISRYLKNTQGAKVVALLLSSLLFMAVHVYWSPNLAVLGFTFLASLLYGGVYLFSGKVESAILCHFLLNAVHMIFFSYHAA